MQQHILTAERRGATKAWHLRREGAIPAVVYGHGVATEHVTLSAKTFTKMYKDAGESTLLNLVIDQSAPRKVLIHDVATDPLDGNVLHVDLYQVNMKERMKARIHIRFIGISPAVKERGGILLKNLTSVNIECLPEHLVHEIVVDISLLHNLGQSMYLRDLTLPPGVVLLDHKDDAIVTVMKPKTEEEFAAELAEETTADIEGAVQVQKKGKDEEEEEGGEGTEGAEPTAEKKEGKEKSAKGGKE